MRKSRHLYSRILLFVLLAITISAAFWFGLIPQRYSPFSPISLESPPVLSLTRGSLPFVMIPPSAKPF